MRALLCILAATIGGEAPDGGFLVKRGVRQLFLDDAGVEAIAGLKRTLHPPRRDPSNPVLVADTAWEHYCSNYGTVLFDPERRKFRMWYLTVPRNRKLRPLEFADRPPRAPHATLVAYAESERGIV